MGNADLMERTKIYALRIIRLYVALPKSTEENRFCVRELRSGRITAKLIVQNPMLILSTKLKRLYKNSMKPLTGWN